MSNKSEVRVIKFNEFVKPNVQVSGSKDWVLNGPNNSFYNDIISAYNNSVTNQTIIKSSLVK